MGVGLSAVSCCFAETWHFFDILDVLERLCVALKLLINLFPSHSHPQGWAKLQGFIGKERFLLGLGHAFLLKGSIFEPLSSIQIDKKRPLPLAFILFKCWLTYRLLFLFESASFSVFIWNSFVCKHTRVREKCCS